MQGPGAIQQPEEPEALRNPLSIRPQFIIPILQPDQGWDLYEKWLDPTWLPRVASHDEDCVQIACSDIYVALNLGYSYVGLRLVELLERELKERKSRPDGNTTKPSLGARVRRITVSTKPQSMEDLTGFGARDMEQAQKCGDVHVQSRALSAAVSYYTYLQRLENLLASKKVFPNLTTLDWEDSVYLPRSMYNTLCFSNITNLKLNRTSINEEFQIKMGNTCRLKSLHIEIGWNKYEPPEKSIFTLCESILHRCAPTLEKLVWSARFLPMNSFGFGTVSGDVLYFPRFPNLCAVNLGYGPQSFHLRDTQTVEHLLKGPLHTLVLDTGSDVIHEYINGRGQIMSLETFIWTGSDGSQFPFCHKFLRANQQLRKLSFVLPQSIRLLEKVIPLLSERFSQLTSLDLTWKENYIPIETLTIIGSLSSLEQLQLSAGPPAKLGFVRLPTRNHPPTQFMKYDWLIDHVNMRGALCSLSRLQKLSFRRDTYRDELSDPKVSNDYYTAQRVSLEEMSWPDYDPSNPGRHFEIRHARRMLFEAQKYIRTFPKLTWMYFGQLPMGVVRNKFQSRSPIILFHQRDDCINALDRIFRIEDWR